MFRLFQTADEKCNSGIFDFKKDKISESLSIDNKVIKTIINELYYPESPYEFSVLSVEILGSAYEQFLGKQIHISDSHRVTIENKPEVRKAGGVYYTPQYIVEYIVKNTVGKLTENKSPKDISKIKIVDPACGSGSFLLGAYQYLLDYHKDYYSQNGKLTPKTGKDTALTPEGNLTTAEKKRILTNNIFGVDIDTNAVEVTKLSLLLKCMEGETDASIATQTKLWNERVLPNIDNNIKSGNSLIDTDFYDGELDFGDEKKIKPFNWQKAFPDVFAQGGFVAVIGNPPYGAELSKEVQEYSLKKFPIGNTDTADLFIIQAERLTKGNGLTGFINPKSFTFSSNWIKTRNSILKNIDIIVDCSKVWKEVKLEMSVYVSRKNNTNNFFTSCIREDEKIIEIGKIDKGLCKEFDFILNGVSEKEIEIGLKLKRDNKTLNDFVINQRGDMLQKYIEDAKKNNKNYYVLGGKQINRYSITESTKGVVLKNLANDKKAFIKEKSILVQRIVVHLMKPHPRVMIIGALSENLDSKEYILVDTINQLQNISKNSSRFILSIINSSLISWYSYKFVFANAIRTMQFDNPTTSKIPFPNLDLNNEPDKSNHNEIINLVNQLLSLNSEKQTVKLQSKIDQIQTRIDYCEDKINKIVYELYGLTEEEIKVVEG